jgi:hypothetical protein
MWIECVGAQSRFTQDQAILDTDVVKKVRLVGVLLTNCRGLGIRPWSDPTPLSAARFAVVNWLNQRRLRVSGKRYSPQEVISKLREAEIYLAEGLSVGDVIRRLGVTKITYYRWRKEYVEMKVEQAKRLKDLTRPR